MKRGWDFECEPIAGLVLSASLWFALSLSGCSNGLQSAQTSDPGQGGMLYGKHCAACHRADGLGANGGGPPLAGSSWVSGPESRLIRIVLQGVRGSIQIRGETYNREMLGFGPVLSDQEIASLLTFVRRQWGTHAASVEPEAIRRIRALTEDRTDYWTAEELLNSP